MSVRDKFVLVESKKLCFADLVGSKTETTQILEIVRPKNNTLWVFYHSILNKNGHSTFIVAPPFIGTLAECMKEWESLRLTDGYKDAKTFVWSSFSTTGSEMVCLNDLTSDEKMELILLWSDQ